MRKWTRAQPTPIDPPGGCPFHPRCWLAVDACSHVVPPLLEYADDHLAACHVTAAEHGMGLLAHNGTEEAMTHG